MTTPGYGTLLKIGDGETPENFTTVAKVRDFEFGEEVEMADSTSHDSGGFGEQIPTIIKIGDMALDILYDPTESTHDKVTGLQYLMRNRVKTNMQIILPGAIETYQFAAYVNKFTRKFPVKELISADVGIGGTGAVS